MYGSMVISLLFWQFANSIVSVSEAKRFYSMFGLIGNVSLPMVSVVFWIFLSDDSNYVPSNLKMQPVLTLVIIFDCVFLALYT